MCATTRQCKSTGILEIAESCTKSNPDVECNQRHGSRLDPVWRVLCIRLARRFKMWTSQGMRIRNVIPIVCLQSLGVLDIVTPHVPATDLKRVMEYVLTHKGSIRMNVALRMHQGGQFIRCCARVHLAGSADRVVPINPGDASSPEAKVRAGAYRRSFALR